MLARRIALLIAALPVWASAQEAISRVTVPALTPVAVRLEEAISSNRNKPGDHFRITVAEDVRVGDVLVIPAGSVGEGEVIHAARSGAGGKAGELILAARYVRVGDIDVRLRSFALGVVGKDQSVNSLAASMIIGPFAMFVKGGVITVPPATLGIAKTALEFELPAIVTSTTDAIKGEENESEVD
ncbi:MAG TPA: hypothetical protein VJP84_02820 [Steroidobacteraceae bacterium]|jgi:hypothetical protein|nr:hypothetical protein [Steroidobacteraceae bacterium]